MNAQEFFDAMRYFGNPEVKDGVSKDTIYGTYAKSLSRFDSEVLQLASEDMVRTRNFRNFPLLAECLEACDNAHRTITLRRERERREQQKAEQQKSGAKELPHSVDPWSEYRIRRADRLMNSDLGRRAAQEGWIIGLHDFCRENDRLPNSGEATQVRLQALANRRQREENEARFGGNPKIIMSVVRAMEAKASRLSGIALGKE